MRFDSDGDDDFVPFILYQELCEISLILMILQGRDALPIL